MNRNIVLLFGIIILFTQCNKEKELKFEITEKISYKSIDYPNDLGMAFQLIKEKDYLLINDFYGDSLINLYNLNSHVIERRLIGVGNGPNELKSPLDIQASSQYIYIYGRPLFTLLRMKKDEIESKAINLEKLSQLPALGDRFLPLTDSLVVFSGMWKKRYALIDVTNPTRIEEFGEYPDFWDAEKDIPTEAKAMFHQSIFVKHPNQPYFASCSDYTIEVYKYNENKIETPELKARVQLGKYDYSFMAGDNVSASPNRKIAPRVMAIAATSKYLYIVMEKEFKGKETHIKVVDWDINPIKILDINKEITTITIDEHNMAYAIINDPENKVITFSVD